jgi:hypothetical protein
MHESHETLRLLGERHVHDLTDYQQHLIAAICVGWPVDAIATRLDVKTRTLYRHLQELAAYVLDPTGIEATRDFLRTRAELQSGCCTALAFALIKENRV